MDRYRQCRCVRTRSRVGQNLFKVKVPGGHGFFVIFKLFVLVCRSSTGNNDNAQEYALPRITLLVRVVDNFLNDK